MLLYVDDSLNIEYSYESLYHRLYNKKTLKKYIYTKKIYDVIVDIAYAMVNGLDVILLDGDFTDNEIANLGIDNKKLSEVYVVEHPCKIKSYDDFKKNIYANVQSVKIGIYTSGTTGTPKMFDHTLYSLLRNIKISEKHKNDVWAFAYNITHFAGIQVLLQALLNENSIIDVFGANAINAYDLLIKYKCSCISATPTYYRNFILNADNSNEIIKNVTFGGEKFSDNLLSKINKNFPNAKIRNVYASTEVGSLLSGKNESFFIPDSLENLIKISSDNHLLLHKSLLLHKKIDEEWYDTNDLVSINRDGTFKILSRDSDFINVGGYKVNPLEVEEFIVNVDGVIDVAVYGRDNSVMGKILVADVMVEDNERQKEIKQEILNKLKSELQAFKVPRIIKFVDNIRKSRTGKKVR